jgi:hypothetical protein
LLGDACRVNVVFDAVVKTKISPFARPVVASKE